MTLCKNCGTREAQPRSDYCEPCEATWLRERRVAFAAPLSPLTHDIFATRPASSWLALGETGRVVFVARTSHNWRLAVVQAVHELVEAALHRHAGVTQAELDAADLIALSRDAPLTDTAHSCGVVWQTALALRLGVPHHLLARATYGTHTPSPHAGIRQAP